jgi:hypothetical protein
MPKTPISSGVSFMPVSEFLKRCDQRTAQQLAGDAGVDVILANLPTDPNIAACLMDASGMFEFALYRGNRYSVADINALCGTPNQPTFATATTGGSLAAGTYGYRVTTTTSLGQTLPSVEILGSTSGSTSTVTLTWPAVVGNITGYKVYGRTPLGELLIATTNVPTYTDTGSITPAGALPTQSTAGVLNAGQAMLFRLISDLTFWFLAQRRPDRKWKMPETYEDTMALLKMLASGEAIFPFLETGNAGLMAHYIEQEKEVVLRNGVVQQARRLFGPRSNDYTSNQP